MYVFCFYSCNSICSAFAHRLYVVSVDGVLSALDWEGQPVWSYQLAQPLFSSTLNYKVNTHYLYLAQPTQDTYVHLFTIVCYACMYVPSLVDTFCSVSFHFGGWVYILLLSLLVSYRLRLEFPCWFRDWTGPSTTGMESSWRYSLFMFFPSRMHDIMCVYQRLHVFKFLYLPLYVYILTW